MSYDSSISVSHSGSYVTGNTVTWTVSGVSSGIFQLANNPITYFDPITRRNKIYYQTILYTTSRSFSYALMEPGQYCIFVSDSAGN